jgi:DNA repair photolyase
MCVARLTDETGVSVTHVHACMHGCSYTHANSYMIDATRWHSQYIYRNKPAWFILITLPHTHFVDVADNLVERESKKLKKQFLNKKNYVFV